MTTEEKAKAYDEALEMAKNVLETDLHESGAWAIKKIFPELKESEGERIRKWLIDTIKSVPNDSIEWDVIDKSCVLAWLEKQKEQKPADLVEEAYIENRNDGTHTCATTKDGFDAFMDGFNKGYELGIKEQTKKQ